MPTMAFGIALAVVFPVLCLLWYLLRCCNLMGGRKKHPSFFCPAICKADEAAPSAVTASLDLADPPSPLSPAYRRTQREHNNPFDLDSSSEGEGDHGSDGDEGGEGAI